MDSSFQENTPDRPGPPAARPLTPTHAFSNEKRGPSVYVSQATAPAKVILLGEHSVVYGHPAVAMAVTRTSHVRVEPGRGRTTVNGTPLNARYHRFIHKALQLMKINEPLRIRTESTIPSAAGMGSSAALSVATVAAVLAGRGKPVTKATLARLAYEVEWRGQSNRGSPTDTSTCALGGGVLISSEPWRPDGLEGPIAWTLRRAKFKWFVHPIELPQLHLIVADSGQKGRTAEQVARVTRLLDRVPAAVDLVADMGRVTREGVEALRDGKLARLGELMNEYHLLLNLAGVGTRRLDELVRVARPHAFGAKITGAGGGGCIVAVTDEPAACARALRQAGAQVHEVQVDPRGVRWSVQERPQREPIGPGPDPTSGADLPGGPEPGA